MTEALDALKAFGASRIAWWANPPRGQCGVATCPEDDAILYEVAPGGVEVCARHYREQAVRDRGYPCDNCGHEPAFRDPLGRKNEMLCNDCHARNGYIPGDRAMVKRLDTRQGVEHPMARREKCIASGHGTECKGQVKQRSSVGVLCDFHSDPVRYKQ